MDNKSILIAMTRNAQIVMRDTPFWCFWPRTRQIARLAKYYQARGLRLKWDAAKRALVVDTL